MRLMLQPCRFLFLFFSLAHCTLIGCQNLDETRNAVVVDSTHVIEEQSIVIEHPVSPDDMPKNYFIHPMKLPVSLSATFAEIRPNHFHGGIDLRIGGKVGEPVYAAADGYVSRIKVTPYGGGKHIYITHPNGFRTVYMHLNDYCEPLHSFVRNYQYAHQVFAFDVELPTDSIKVVQGQLIAHAGNTGSSGGPHLHYEIRFADNDQPVNPLYFGIDYKDPIPPTIANIKLYPADSNSLIDGIHSEWSSLARRKQGKRYATVRCDSAVVSGRFYAGIYAYDVSEPSQGKNGVERIEMLIDGEVVSTYSVPTYIYEETRSVNVHIDYPQYNKNKEYYILSRRLPNVRYPKVNVSRDGGYLCFHDTGQHTLEYRVYDYKGNVTKRTIKLRSEPSKIPNGQTIASNDSVSKALVVNCRKSYAIDSIGFKASLKSGTLYANDTFEFKTWRKHGCVGPVYTFIPHTHPYPPSQSYNLAIKIPDTLKIPKDKLTIVTVGKKVTACESRINSGWLESDVRTFGAFSIAVDTVAPNVKPLNFSNNSKFVGKELNLKVTDNLAGVATYNCYANGNWVLCEYDPKNASLLIDASVMKRGANNFSVEVGDALGNVTVRSYKIFR